MANDDDRELQIARSWRANAAAWSDSVRGGRIPSRGAGTDAAIVEAVLRADPASVLDLGCGEGWLLRALGARGIEAFGVDASPELVAIARATHGTRCECVSYRELARELPARRFDVVVFNFALFGEDLGEPLHAARARLHPGGMMIVQTLHPRVVGGDVAPADGWRIEDFAGIAGDFRESMPWYFRTARSWRETLSAAGFALVRSEEPRDASGALLSLLMCARREDAEAAPGYVDRAPAA
jgi:2-polyprenyl-3-methyl-5-hydroxy-6-metoxy-1,4-benzoquinol methylase